MFDLLRTRWRQGRRTIDPAHPPPLPDRFRGRPALDEARCPDGCRACAEACPTGAVSFTTDHRLATRTRDGLDTRAFELATALHGRIRSLFGRSLKLRVVSAGGCNGCESDVNVLSTVGFDLGRFGIQVVASPRHADGLLVTGPVSRNMEEALLQTWEALPDPRLVIAVGACAISGGPFSGHPEVLDGVRLPVDLYVPGCPPHPLTLLDGLLRLIGRLDTNEG